MCHYGDIQRGRLLDEVSAQSDQASDQWAFYQAKSIKGYLYELQRDKLQLELKAQGASFSPDAVNEYKKSIEAAEGKIREYKKERDEIQKEAKKLEVFRTDCGAHSAAFGFGVIFLQIAILLSSIAALMKKKPLWITGMAVGVVGIVHFVNGFFLFLK